MNGIVKKLLCYLILPLLIVLLGWLIVKSVMKPVEFNKQKAAREQVGIQRLKDIRDLQVAFNSVNGHFASTLDSLKDFYKKGEMSVTMQVGSRDDSLAMAHTEKIKRTVKTPVLLTGGVQTKAQAEELLRQEKADLIGVGRALLKDAAWSSALYTE